MRIENEHDTSFNDETDRLIDRAITGEASPGEWNHLIDRSDSEPALWRRTVETLHDQAMFAFVADRAGAIADRVQATDSPPSPARSTVSTTRLSSWAGWFTAAAAIVALAISHNSNLTTSPTEPGGDRSSDAALAGLPASQLFDRYVERGREEGTVLDDEPKRIVLETRPVPDGEGFEIIYVRQVVERAVFDNLYEYRGADERGVPTLAPLDRSPPRPF